MSAVKNNSWNRSMLSQNFSESLKCYPYPQFIFLLCFCVIKAREPGEAGGQATLWAENMLGLNSHSQSPPSEWTRSQITTGSLTLCAPVTPYHSRRQPPDKLWTPNSQNFLPIFSQAPHEQQTHMVWALLSFAAPNGPWDVRASSPLRLHGPVFTLSF